MNRYIFDLYSPHHDGWYEVSVDTNTGEVKFTIIRKDEDGHGITMISSTGIFDLLKNGGYLP